jgi:hypothetical protein
MFIDRPAPIRIEAQYVPADQIECGTQQISPLAEHCIQIPRTPFEPAMADCRGERHVALLHRDTQMPEDGTEMRIIRLVEDNEAGVDRNLGIPISYRRPAMPFRKQ